MSEENKLSRREFIKDAAVASAAVAAGVLSASAAAAAPIPTKWDKVADVVIVGFGGAGGSAAWETCKAGAKTIIVESAKDGGGSTNICGGAIYLGGGTALQKALGFTDTVEEMYKYVMGVMGEGKDEAQIRIYCDQSLATYDWLVNTLGVKFNQSLLDMYPAKAPTLPYGLNYSGSEALQSFAAIAKPAPRGHWCSEHSGLGLFQPLKAAVVKAGPEILYETHANKLVVNPDTGRAVGVVAKVGGKDIYIKASRGIVLAAGGFGVNKDMLAMYAPAFARLWHAPIGTGADDGSGIKLGQAIGAELRNMQYCQAYQLSVGQMSSLSRGILVSDRGQRFVSEDLDEGDPQGKMIYQNFPVSYLIIDSAIYKDQATPPATASIKAQAGTIKELATALKTGPGVLEDTIAFYNQGAANGQDPLFGKDKRFLVPLSTPPFYALDAGAWTVWWYTSGGLQTNPKAQVLDTTGAPIPALYAAGRNAGNGLAANYPGGGYSVGSAMIFGRIAGKNAAAEKPWDVNV